MDRIETAYGFVDRAALLQARESFDMAGLLRCIDELKQAADSLDSERGLRDSFMRLYCMMTTILFGARATVPPQDGDLSSLLRDIRSGLHDNIAFAQTCIATIEPLERLQGQQDAPLSDDRIEALREALERQSPGAEPKLRCPISESPHSKFEYALQYGMLSTPRWPTAHSAT
jgi:hypothetical protein